ncbi:MAG: acetyl-CoA carboxylase biotin carboxylase subunit [Fusobacteria bacterium]|nr:acetyl-CoA carboxylase biotin carboxylase subunit [Fusobacteriota bacterium]
MFKKILIANRGEIAVRIIRSAKELGIKTVAIYSEADKESLHVRLADEAVCVGSTYATNSYLKIPNIIAAAEITEADAIHPGYGFLSENEEFASICESHGIVFIGPTAECIHKMGDKVTARKTAEKFGVPVTPGTKDLVQTEEEAVEMAGKIGYPVMLKASSGGGGKGMRVANNEEEVRANLKICKNEAMANFGNDDMYIEKYILNPKHIEIQVIGDKYGNAIHLGERDCSIQRRNQKMIEEAPSIILDSDLRNKMGESAVRITKGIHYDSVGTFEFLVDQHKNYYFMEMNTRVQVEHTVTELVTGIDIIKTQIMIAAGERLSVRQSEVKLSGHAIECRINAEDPSMNFMPSAGLITHYIPSGGLGVRIDSHIFSGYEISPYYDSMIGKLIVYGADREEAIERMKRALDEHIIEGVKVTTPFLRKIMDDEDYIAGKVYTNFIDLFMKK